jgi:hypothetical protein
MNATALKLSTLAAPCAALALAALAGPAGAVTTLTIAADTQKTGTNPEDVKCIIAGNSCPGGKQGSFVYVDYTQGGTSTDRDIYSLNPYGTDPQYTVGYLAGFGYTAFDIGIDVNTTSAKSETLTLFEVLVNGVVEYSFSTSTNIGQVSFNGNGFSDWTLSSVDLSTFLSTDIVTFHAVWTGDVDGPESFFLVQTNPIPEPGSYAMLMAGLGVVGYMARRRRQQA